MNMAWPKLADEWEHAVAAYLRANPDWLAGHPELYGALAPPERIHGEAMADHMAAMLGRARRDAACMAAQAEAVLAAQRATAVVVSRVHEAVVALIGCTDVGACLAGEVALVLELDAVCLCRLGAGDRQAVRLLGVLGRREVLFREMPGDAALLYAEAAPLAAWDVLIRLPEVGVLALAARGGRDGAPRYSGAAFQFLGRAVAARLGMDG